MEQDLQKLWKNILKEIEKEVSKGNYIALFKSTQLLSLANDIAEIAAPSTMVIDMLQKRFSGLIKKHLDQQQPGQSFTLSFVPKTLTSSKQKTEAGPLLSLTQEEKPKTIGHLPRVRQDYTFNTLAVSGSNQLAFVAASTVAKNIGTSYNPLFIYGPTGVGKTHLMQAIANEVYNTTPEKKIIYTTSEEFTNEVIEAIKTNDTGRMKKRFRSAYLLIIDDIQFIAGKDRVQEELFHTFNILIDNGSQIILSSDRPPQEIKKLEKRLSSRFSGGLTVDVEPPDFELKIAILQKKAEKYNFILSFENAALLAEKAEDGRSLEGLLLRAVTLAQAKDSEITRVVVEQALGARVEERGVRLHPDDIIKAVCKFYDVKPTQIKGPKRDAGLVKARQMAMYLLKRELDLTFVEIGNQLGGRDHTTIMHGVEKVESLLKNKPVITEDISGITKELRG